MKLIIEPTDGVGAILSQIEAAKRSIEIAIFRLDRKDIEAALEEAAARGIRVNALIASASRGGEQTLRRLELRLLDAGVTVARTAEDLNRYHNKYMVIDRRVLCLLSMNLTRIDIDHSRGFGIVTDRPEWVTEARRLFKADASRTPFTTRSSTLVVSPVNARKTLGAFLRDAKKELLIYDPKISDKEMLRILQERKKAGVSIRVIGAVVGAGFDAQKLGGLRLHTRTIVRDRRDVFIGSQSLRGSELDSRRELGLIVHDPGMVKRIAQTFEADWEPDRSRQSEKDNDADAESKDADKAAQVLQKELTPVVNTVRKAVKRAVATAGEDAVHDKQIRNTMKKIVKKAVKAAVHDAVLDTQEA